MLHEDHQTEINSDVRICNDKIRFYHNKIKRYFDVEKLNDKINKLFNENDIYTCLNERFEELHPGRTCNQLTFVYNVPPKCIGRIWDILIPLGLKYISGNIIIYFLGKVNKLCIIDNYDDLINELLHFKDIINILQQCKSRKIDKLHIKYAVEYIFWKTLLRYLKSIKFVSKRF